MKMRFVLLLLLCFSCALQAQLPAPQPANPLFKDRPFGPVAPPTPTPQRKANVFQEEEKPIPREWIIGGSIAGALLVIAILYLATRRWRSSNLFDREYRFPYNEDVAVRFGAQKCGGLMATLRWNESRAAPGLTKDT